MNPMIPKRTRRLRARAAAINQQDDEFEDYGPEPNMKLSHAFIVVLLLHVIAVGGIYAFQKFRADKYPTLAAAKAITPTQPSSDSSNQSDPSGQPGPGQEDPGNNPTPSGEKPPMVPKTAEIENSSVHKGLLATLKAALRRVTGHLVAAGTVTTAAAQESTNAETAGQSTAPVQGTPAATTPGTYVVKSGDTITRIASSTGVTILNLEKANGLTQTSVLQVGEKLTIPAKEETPATVDASIGAAPQAPATAPVSTTNAPATTAADAVTANMTDYTVVKGDNPYKIARKFKISTVELMKANNITDPKKIQIGQKLKIPASTKVAK